MALVTLQAIHRRIGRSWTLVEMLCYETADTASRSDVNKFRTGSISGSSLLGDDTSTNELGDVAETMSLLEC